MDQGFANLRLAGVIALARAGRIARKGKETDGNDPGQTNQQQYAAKA